MSTDLRQFFTTDHVPDKLEPNSYEKFFINALSYISPKAIDDLTIAFEEDESNDLIQNFQEVDLLDEHVFPDVISYELEQVILSPFFDKDEFVLDGFNTIIEGLYDEQNETFVKVDFVIPQLKSIFEELYTEAKAWCEYSDEILSEPKIDYYNLGTIEMQFLYIKFKNKSKARKFRKLYKKSYQIRATLYGFEYRFENGQFVKGNVRDIESEGWEYPDLNFGVANEALEIMANISKKQRYNTELLQLEIERKVDDCEYNFTSNALISALSNTLKTKNEVIM
ncbi:MAG: hypothetical protein ACLUJI_00530 [Faecalibacillus faecis]|uniref:hypothetical protein n=1 Tax=Faecalibacillus faecis TaxID=1982628 RepID=UPI003996BA7F